jgi:hypothetical protein
MSADLERLLSEAAATPEAAVDPDALHARAVAARRRERVLVATGGVVLLAVLAAGVALSLRDPRIELGPAEEPPPPAEPGWPLRLRAEAVLSPPGGSGVPVVVELEGDSWDDWLAARVETAVGDDPTGVIVSPAGERRLAEDVDVSAPFDVLRRAADSVGPLYRHQPGPAPWWRQAIEPAMPHPLLRPWSASADRAAATGGTAIPLEVEDVWEERLHTTAERFGVTPEDLAVHRWMVDDEACDTMTGDCEVRVTALMIEDLDVPLLVEVRGGGGWDGRLEVTHLELAAATPQAAEAVDAVALVGLWEVLDAGEEPGTILKLGTGQLALLRPCGPIWGAWNADAAGLFVAGASAWHGPCGDDPRPAWLTAVAAHRPEEEGHVLLDAAGGVVARLVPGDEPTLPDTVAQSEAAPPEVTDDTRRRLGPSAPLPAGLVAVDAGSVVGRWVPSDAPAGSEAHAELQADGEWSGSDGCNGLGGRWRTGTGGALLAVGGGHNLAGCGNIPVQDRLERTARAGFDGDVLVLLDRQGDEVGRFTRAGSRGRHAELPEEPDLRYGCGTGYPAATWAGEQPLAELDHPGREELVAELRLDDLAGWVVLDAAEAHLTVARQREPPPADGDARTHEVAAVGLVEGAWMLIEASSCTPRLVLDGLGPAEVWLDGPPDADAAHVDLALVEIGCASGESAEGRVEVVRLVEGADAVEIALGVRSYGNAMCPSNPTTLVRVPLSAPLGDRTVLDATLLSPGPLDTHP